jgi:hypothetical protein
MMRNPSYGSKRVFGKEISNLPETIQGRDLKINP